VTRQPHPFHEATDLDVDRATVADMSAAIATELGQDPNEVKGVKLAAHIHDIGEIGVPAELLNRPDRLRRAEFELVKQHPQLGHDIVADMEFPWPIADMILQHHERLDGSGYPAGLRGDEITLGARIIAVADVVGAMTEHRPYRPALGAEAAVAAITEGTGTLFDPEVVNACLRILNRRDQRQR
jgi:HD-GYP domain-containing protein (c-di-GMP phosphodiesterase class II)